MAPLGRLFSHDFPVPLVEALFQRFELSVNSGPSLSAVPDSEGERAMIGWGHVLYGTLATMDESSPRSESADEFLYSCDALLAFRRLQFICSVYYHDHHPAPSRTLVQICHRVTLRLLELCKEFTASLLQPSPSSMTSFRYAKLLMALAPLAVRETGIFDDVFRVLRQCGVQLSDDQPDTIGWRWFLDQTQRQSPIACGPTALILTSLVSVESALQTA